QGRRRLLAQGYITLSSTKHVLPIPNNTFMQLHQLAILPLKGHHLDQVFNNQSTSTSYSHPTPDTTITMSIIVTLILAQLCLIYVSAMAIPPTNAATIPIWDIERATSFNALLAASVKNTRYAPDMQSASHGSEAASSQSANVTKRRKTARQAKHLPSIKNMPNGGMQCAVM
ncbi:hypothetical protein JI435_104360, partial [Parastagonospora nodorum SN15]